MSSTNYPSFDPIKPTHNELVSSPWCGSHMLRGRPSDLDFSFLLNSIHALVTREDC